MSNESKKPETKPEETNNVEIEALSDEALENVAGGAMSMCSYAACSNKD